MAGRIDEFFAEIGKTGVAKASHFDVMVSLPTNVNGGLDFLRTMSLRCEAAELPGRSLTTQDARIYGPVYKTVSQSVYNDLTLTFLDTQNLDVRFFFESWMNAIFDSATNQQAYPDNFVGGLEITQYDTSPPSGKETQLVPTMKFKLIRAFPTLINPMTSAWTDDAFQRVQVTFVYEYYTIEQTPVKLTKVPLVMAPKFTPLFTVENRLLAHQQTLTDPNHRIIDPDADTVEQSKQPVAYSEAAAHADDPDFDT